LSKIKTSKMWYITTFVARGCYVCRMIKHVASLVLANEENERLPQIVGNLNTQSHYVFSLRKRIHKDHGDMKWMKSHDSHVT
jgi:hypothetical protein